jgi:hypothetical protein
MCRVLSGGGGSTISKVPVPSRGADGIISKGEICFIPAGKRVTECRLRPIDRYIGGFRYFIKTSLVIDR